jgi:hypothetical protein
MENGKWNQLNRCHLLTFRFHYWWIFRTSCSNISAGDDVVCNLLPRSHGDE